MLFSNCRLSHLFTGSALVAGLSASGAVFEILDVDQQSAARSRARYLGTGSPDDPPGPVDTGTLVSSAANTAAGLWNSGPLGVSAVAIFNGRELARSAASGQTQTQIGSGTDAAFGPVTANAVGDVLAQSRTTFNVSAQGLLATSSFGFFREELDLKFRIDDGPSQILSLTASLSGNDPDFLDQYAGSLTVLNSLGETVGQLSVSEPDGGPSSRDLELQPGEYRLLADFSAFVSYASNIPSPQTVNGAWEYSASMTPIPEPAHFAGLAGLGLLAWRIGRRFKA